MAFEIRINEPGAGDWIMDQCEGVFRPGLDHSIATFEGEEIQGGFVFCQYLGRSIAVHNGGSHPRWCSRDLLWMCFHYAFRQLGCGKLIAPTASDNYRALAINLRAGFYPETIVRDAFARGRHLIVLTMEAGGCRWLRDITPQSWEPRTTVVRSDG
jgi:hypothetical protein